MKRWVLFIAAIGAMAPAVCRAQHVSEPVSQTAALGSGAYKAIMEADPGLKGFTVYRPQNLAALRAHKLPIVVWGEGGCANEGNRFRWFLSEIASHGYVVVAVGPILPPEKEIWNAAPPQPGRGQQPGRPQQAGRAQQPGRGALPTPGALPPAATHSAQLIQGMDWAIAENGRKGGQYFGKLETGKIAAMGMSCGGGQALEAGLDPRVTTTVLWNSGLFPDDTNSNSMFGGKPLKKADLNQMHGAVAYISGDETDIAFINANDDFSKLPNIPAFRAYKKGVPHDGTYGDVNGGAFGKVAVAWLDWRLKNDAKAGQIFLGPKCGLCADPEWVVQQKNLK